MPDTIILRLIKENNLSGWALLYDKYAAVMYGVISSHTADKGVAEQIFASLFTGLKQEQHLLKASGALCVCLLRYSYTNTGEELKKRGINYTKIPNKTSSILDIICSQYTTIKKVSDKIKVGETEVKQLLQKEVFMLRSNDKFTSPIL